MLSTVTGSGGRSPASAQVVGVVENRVAESRVQHSGHLFRLIAIDAEIRNVSVPATMLSLRIAIVGRYPVDPGGFVGGVEASTAHLIEGLLALGQTDIHVVTTSSVRTSVTREDGPVRYHYLPSPRTLQTLSWYAIPRRRIHRELDRINPDVVHAQGAQMYGNICLGTRFPVVVSVHGIVTEEMKHVRGLRAGMRGYIRGVVVQKSVIRRARHIIQPTSYPESHFASITSAQWHDTGNAVAQIFFDQSSSTPRQHILYSGAVVRRKRLADLIEAFALVADEAPGELLKVAGPMADAAYAAEVHGLIGARDLTERVVFLGLLDRSQLASEYRACRALVLLSGQETSPMVIVEAMASSAPVVATDVGGVRYLVDDGVSGFVVPVGDVEASADRLRRLISDPGLCESFGKAGHDKAQGSFTSEAVAKRVLAVYEQAVSEAASRST